VLWCARRPHCLPVFPCPRRHRSPKLGHHHTPERGAVRFIQGGRYVRIYLSRGALTSYTSRRGAQSTTHRVLQILRMRRCMHIRSSIPSFWVRPFDVFRRSFFLISWTASHPLPYSWQPTSSPWPSMPSGSSSPIHGSTRPPLPDSSSLAFAWYVLRCLSNSLVNLRCLFGPPA
jgi:hypothetical protein